MIRLGARCYSIYLHDDPNSSIPLGAPMLYAYKMKQWVTASCFYSCHPSDSEPAARQSGERIDLALRVATLLTESRSGSASRRPWDDLSRL